MLPLRLPARLEYLEQYLDFVEVRGREDGFSPLQIKEIQLAVEEAVVNIIHHAYPQASGEIEVRWRTGTVAGRVEIDIEDRGVPFDPRSKAAPDLRSGLEERKVGGLGIYFIDQLTEETIWRREGGKNILTLVFVPRPGGPAARIRPTAEGMSESGFPLETMTRETHAKGSVLFQKGDPAGKMFYIASGSIRLPEIEKIVRTGDVIGEMGLLSPFHIRTASALCEENCVVYSIDKEEVTRLFSRDSDMAFKIVHLCVQRFIENLKAETEAKERIQSELRIARDIQAAMLPRVFPPFPNRPEFEIFALMEPAKEVGGDFYDFFLIDDDRVGVAIGDVSGKGVPAALFMAICKTLLKTEAMRGHSPGEVLRRLNAALIPDNEMMMFVTVFFLVLNLRTGEIAYADGGHPPPFVSDGSGLYRTLPGPTGTFLGILEGCGYSTTTGRLRPGEAVFLFSDGVSEATNASLELFTESRINRTLDSGLGTSPQKMVEGMREAVRVFAGGTPPPDDVTIVAVALNALTS
ncbi:MAG: SpoIIE family protein phosphatase [Candidatus Aminicenantes bacterium]|nr:SpoIIE family protein phosphatase [Candidatus Aminicenantes bacterium]